MDIRGSAAPRFLSPADQGTQCDPSCSQYRQSKHCPQGPETHRRSGLTIQLHKGILGSEKTENGCEFFLSAFSDVKSKTKDFLMLAFSLEVDTETVPQKLWTLLYLLSHNSRNYQVLIDRTPKSGKRLIGQRSVHKSKT